MDLKSLMLDTKAAWVEYPGMPGFMVEVVNLSRKELTKLRKDCITQVFNKRRQMEEVFDEEKFVDLFTTKVVTNWKGLKLKYLEEILLVDISGQDPEKELDYTVENAKLLVTSSTEFDNWLNEVVFDLDNFRTGTKETPVE